MCAAPMLKYPHIHNHFFHPDAPDTPGIKNRKTSH